MSSAPLVWSASRLSHFQQRIAERLKEGEKKFSTTVLRLADKRIPHEWVFVTLGAIALVAFLFILFFASYRR